MSDIDTSNGATPLIHSLHLPDNSSSFLRPGAEQTQDPSAVLANPFGTNQLTPRDYLEIRAKLSPSPDELLQKKSVAVENHSETQEAGATRRDQRQHPETIVQGNAKEQKAYDLDQRHPGAMTTPSTVDHAKMVVRPVLTSASHSMPNNMPRTSSIDSAISTVSAVSIQKGLSDQDPSLTSIRSLIGAAGTAENLILHMLRERNQAATQNSKLWTLVEKQKTLLLGFQKDLERVTKERDKYKRRLKEAQISGGPPRATTQSPSRNRVQQHVSAGDADGNSNNHHHHNNNNSNNVVPDLPNNRDLNPSNNHEDSTLDAPGPAIYLHEDLRPPNLTFTKELPALQTQTSQSILPKTSELSPLSEKSFKGLSSTRKAPAPLNLVSNNTVSSPPLSLASPTERKQLAQEDDNDEEEDTYESRGRRPTREDDDRDREKSLKKEMEARSRSKKESSGPHAALEHNQVEASRTPAAPAVLVPLPSSPRPAANFSSNSLHPASLSERLISAPLKSPGLPSSPRPFMNNSSSFGSLPMSPRMPSMPLSPRAPKQAVPAPLNATPFTDPAMTQRQNLLIRIEPQEVSDRPQTHNSPILTDPPAVFQGLINSTYPNLLLPPNALPSIQVRVASSRLQPSRHSMLGLRTQEESAVFSLSIFSRASRQELWRIEKIPVALPQLDQQLKIMAKDLPKLPDRRLFSGQSPTTVDARRVAIDTYFEDLLDVELDEPSALILCRFLSTDVLNRSSTTAAHPGINEEAVPKATQFGGRAVKTGFLTKRGKNFGGWKSRYFVLDSPELRYFETPGGAHMGTIKIGNAKIGVQKAEEPGSDADDQYRHAFLIQEPKKKDSATYVRHVLCAESDADRDQWVQALLHYVEDGGRADSQSTQASLSSTTGGARMTPTQSQQEARVPSSLKDRDASSNTPSPKSASSMVDAFDHLPRSAISAPMNGAPIQDGTRWGNRTNTPQGRDNKGGVMGKLFHSRKPSSELMNKEASTKPRVLRHNGYVRAVFGLPLADAVEFCSPFNVDVKLPAVIYRSIEYLRFRNAANEEGLFRLSGSNITVKTLKERFNNEGDIDLVDEEEFYDVHAVASLFKTYLRELPAPLLTRDLHIEFLKVLELESQADKISAYNILVHRLPTVNFELIRAVSEYLLEVTENAGKNKMSIRNIGIVFSPTVNIPTPLFNLFLSEFDAIFEQQPSQRTSSDAVSAQEVRISPTMLTPEDIRSPRHQMFSDLPTPAYNQTQFPSASSKLQNNSPSAEFGLTPLHPSYEQGNYVSLPLEVRQVQAIAPPADDGKPDIDAEETYGSLNRMMVPTDARSAKARKRESAMFM